MTYANEDDHTTPFGKLMRRVRRERGLNQRDTAAIFGIAQGHLSAVERGEKNPQDYMIEGLVDRFDVDRAEAEHAARMSQTLVNLDLRKLPGKAREAILEMVHGVNAARERRPLLA